MSSATRRLAVAVRRTPVTLGLLAMLWTAGLATGSIGHGPPARLAAQLAIGVEPLSAGAWWTAGTSMLWCADAAGYLATTLLALAFCLPAERRLGPVRTATILVLSHVGGVLVALSLVAAAARTGEIWSTHLATATVLGPSPAISGVALAWSATFGPPWRRRIRLVLLASLLMLVLYSGQLQDVVRLCAGLVGLLLGAIAARRVPAHNRHLPARDPAGDMAGDMAGPPGRPEVRVLLALVVAASAIGPVIAAVSRTTIGPLSLLQYVFLSPRPDASDVRDACADPAWIDYCRTAQAQMHLGGFAPAFLSVLPVVALLVMAEGLRRGRRFALWGALTINVALTLCGAVFFELIPAFLDGSADLGSYQDVEFVIGVLTSTVQPLAVAVLLLVNRRAFDVRAPGGTYRGVAVAAAVALVVVCGSYLGAGYLVRTQFQPAPTFGALIADLPLRFLPTGYLGKITLSFVPVGPVAVAVHEWAGASFWLIVLVGITRTFWRSRVHRDATGAERARRMLVRHGGSELSYMATWRGNSYWFAPDGQAVVAYRVVASVALTTGDPIGEPAALPAAASGFAEFCAAQGWIPCFYSVTAGLAPALAAAGWRLVQVAEETQLPLAELRFTGRRWQDVRTAMNKAKKLGITAQWYRYRDSPPSISAQIRAISARWLHGKDMPELGFTLGGLRELGDDNVRCLVAIDGAGFVHAVTSWLPVYRAGRVAGWTLDFMRRRTEGPGGVMEFLIASAALEFQQEGAEFVSLSGAPLARREHVDGDRIAATAAQRLLDVTGRLLEPVYGFRSLHAFKSKFQPVYRPLYLAYPDPAALPAIASAVTRAYLPRVTLVQVLRLVQRIAAGAGGAPPHLIPAATPRPARLPSSAPPIPLPTPLPTVPLPRQRPGAPDALAGRRGDAG